MKGIANVRFDPLRLVAQGLHQIHKLAATRPRVQGRETFRCGQKMPSDPLITIACTTGGPQNVAVLWCKGALILLAVLFFIKLRYIGNGNGIDSNKPAFHPTHVPQCSAVPVQGCNHGRLLTPRQRAGSMGCDSVFSAQFGVHIWIETGRVSTRRKGAQPTMQWDYFPPCHWGTG